MAEEERQKITAVIFDLDGLMVDTERYSKEAWDEVCKEYPLQIGKEFFARARGMNVEAISKVFEEMYGDIVSYEEIHDKKVRVMRSRIEREGIPPKKGILELLDYLEASGRKTAIASGSREEGVRNTLKQAGINRKFPIIIGGDMVEKCKPDPEVFLTAAKCLGEKPENCLVLEDSVNGVKAALNGEFHIIMIPDMIEPPPELKKRLSGLYDSLLEVIPFLQERE